MSQEQAKSPPEKETPGAKDETKGPIEAIMRGTERKSGETSALDRSLDPKRSTLAERLKAEQRKREEPRREEPRREEAPREEPRREELRRAQLVEAEKGLRAEEPEDLAFEGKVTQRIT